MNELVACLRVALSETWAFYFKAHSFHWNVRGPLFRQFHELFGDIYEDAHGAVDGLAERIRTLGRFAPASLDEIASLATIPFTNVPSTAEMLTQLISANDDVIGALRNVNDAISVAGSSNVGLSNYVQERLDIHAKWEWQLLATVSDDLGGPK